MQFEHSSNIYSLQVASIEFNGVDGKLNGETGRRPHGWAEPVAKGGLRGGGLIDGCMEVEEHRWGDKKVLNEEVANIIQDIIQKIIASKEGLRGADEEVGLEELELIVLDQPGRGWKEVVDEVLLSQV